MEFLPSRTLQQTGETTGYQDSLKVAHLANTHQHERYGVQHLPCIELRDGNEEYLKSYNSKPTRSCALPLICQAGLETPIGLQ